MNDRLGLEEDNIYSSFNNNVLDQEEKEYLKSILRKEKDNICESVLKYKNQKYLTDILHKQFLTIANIEFKLKLD